MYYLNDICFLCLVYVKNIKLKENNYFKIREEFHYLIPEHIIHNSETPKYVCNDCIQNLTKLNAFRRKCLNNIAIYNEYEQKLTQYSGSHKYLTIVLTDISHQNKAGLDCDVEIKTERFEVDDSTKDIKIEEINFVTENEEKINGDSNNDREVKSKICEINCFNSPTQSQTEELNIDTEVNEASIKDESEIQEIYIKHEINAEFVIKDDEQDSQNDLFNKNVPGNSATNENDSTAAVSMCTQDQNLLQTVEMVKCENFPETFSNEKNLKIPHRIHTKKSHICDVCQKSFSTSACLKDHKLVHTSKKRHVCDVCQKTFGRNSDLKTHKIVHTGEKSFVCDVCQKAFNRMFILRRHKRVHLGEKPEKPYSCDVCSKAFRFSCALKTHKRTHSGEKPYSCDVCQKAFTQIAHLRDHKFIHSGEKPHACDVCQKVFSRIYSLKKHMLTHTGEKPYSCDVCQKSFTQIGHLNIHKLIHSGEKQYVCGVCQKVFKKLGHLKSHKLIHNVQSTQEQVQRSDNSIKECLVK